MNARERKAYNDGMSAFAAGLDYDANARRSPGLRKHWNNGWEQARRQQTASRVTPEQIEESDAAIADLKAKLRSL